MTVLEMAEKYYPAFWSRERLEALVAAGRLTRAEADAVLGGEAATEAGEAEA